MSKLIAILNVVAWSGFWAFGYLALTSDTQGGQMIVAMLLAVLGAGAGVWAYMWLVRHSETTGYARRPNRAVPEQYREEGGEV